MDVFNRSSDKVLPSRLLFASGASVLWYHEHYGCDDCDRNSGGVALPLFAQKNNSNGSDNDKKSNYNLRLTAVICSHKNIVALK